jgi:hypothetical protein
MPTARFRLATAVLDEKLYAIGGTDSYVFPGEKSLTTNEVYTPTESNAPSHQEPNNPNELLRAVLLVGGITLAAIIVALAIVKKTRRNTAPINGLFGNGN